MENKEVDSRAEIETGSLPKVGKAINQWQVKADEALAESFQKMEIDSKLQRNRTQRQIARTDVPIVKTTVQKEMANLNLIRQRQQELEDEDAIIARQVYVEEMIRLKEEEKARRFNEEQDQLYARQLSVKLSSSHSSEQRTHVVKRSQSERPAANQAALIKNTRSNTFNPQAKNLNLSARLMSDSSVQYPVTTENYVALETSGYYGDQLLNDNNVNESLYASHIDRPAELPANDEDEAIAKNMYEAELQNKAMMSKEMLKRIEEQDAKLARMLQEKEKQCISPIVQPGVDNDAQIALVLQQEEEQRALRRAYASRRYNSLPSNH